MEDSTFEISPEFVEENQRLCKTRQKSGGPYNKKDRFARRQEVYRLHFEMGYSAVKIAEIMKINRNTINSDVKYWYTKLATHFMDRPFHAYMEKYQIRLESQRTRLVEELNKHDELEDKLSIEKLILDIDSKINSMLLKYYTANMFITNVTVNQANSALKEQKQNVRYYSYSELVPITKEKRHAIDQILSGKYTLVKTRKEGDYITTERHGDDAKIVV